MFKDKTGRVVSELVCQVPSKQIKLLIASARESKHFNLFTPAVPYW